MKGIFCHFLLHHLLDVQNMIRFIQEPLNQMDGIAVNGPDIRKDGLKPCKWLKIMSKIFEKILSNG